MAEIVGLIASIIGIIDGIDKSKSVIKKYIHSSSSLRGELVPLLGKLTAFVGILRGIQLECELDESDDGRLQVFAHIREPLEASKRASQAIATRLSQMFSVGKVSIAFGKVINSETQAALRVLDQSKAILELALTADQRTLLKSIETYTRAAVADLSNIRENVGAMKATADDSAKAAAKLSTLTWISPVRVNSNYQAALKQCRDDDASGDWFFDSQLFQNWALDGKARGLALAGISGAGKTVICSKAIRYFHDQDRAPDSLVLKFFFDFNDAAKQSVEGMVRSLISQLASELDEIPKDLQALYSKQHSNPSTSEMPDVQAWCDILYSLFMNDKDTYVFIDALDECVESESFLLQETLQDLFEKTGPSIRWFLTARPANRPLLDLLKIGFAQLPMDTKVIGSDIEAYISTKMKKDARLASFGPTARDLVVTGIKANSAGMFRFAQCQLDVLMKLKDRRVSKVRQILTTMPKDISSMYGRIISELKSCDDWSIVERVLAIVSYSARPMTVMEVAEFAVLEDGMATISSEERFEDFSEILSLTSNLVALNDGLLTLAHKSVQDFLASSYQPGRDHNVYSTDLLDDSADLYIAKRCMQYLSFPQQPIRAVAGGGDFKDPNSRHLTKLLQEFPFLHYAASRWPYHVRTAEAQKALREHMSFALSLSEKPPVREPNLWKAWLMLQRIDIWDTQIETATLMSEALIRSSLVPSWSYDFWGERQSYRVIQTGSPHSNNDARTKESAKTNARASIHRIASKYSAALSKTHDFVKGAERKNKVDECIPKEPSGTNMDPGSYVKALYTREALADTELSFSEGDLILVHESSDQSLWRGTLIGKTGLVPKILVQRTKETPWGTLHGALYYDLAVVLLEVALQKSLFSELRSLWDKIVSEKTLSVLLHRLEELIARAAVIMGKDYGKVLRQILTHVKFAHEDVTDGICEDQEDAMAQVHLPLQSMMKSGFRASRSAVGGRHKVKRLAERSATSMQQPQSLDNFEAPYSVPNTGWNRELHSFSVEQYTSAPPNGMSSESMTYMSMTRQVVTPATHSAPPRQPMPEQTIGYYESGPSPELTAYQAISSQRITVSLLEPVTENPTDSPPKPNPTPPEDVQPLSKPHPYPQQEAALKSPKTGHARHVILPPLSKILTVPPELPGNLEARIIYLENTKQNVLKTGEADEQVAWAEKVCLSLSPKFLPNTWISGPQPPKLESELKRIQDLEQNARGIISVLGDQNHPNAKFLEAYCHEFGRCGNAVDERMAWFCYQDAFQLGSYRAAYHLGPSLEKVGSNSSALRYYNTGASAGDPACLYQIGMILLQGSHDQTQDYGRAVAFLRRSAECADLHAPQGAYTYALLLVHQLPDVIVPTAYLTEGPDVAWRHLLRAAELGFAKAQMHVAQSYECATFGCELDPTRSVFYNSLAAEQGEPEAEMAISRWFLCGAQGHFEPHYGAAFLYAQRAAQRGLAGGEFAIGYYHEVGIHVQADLAVAMQWYKMAADKGLEPAVQKVSELSKG